MKSDRIAQLLKTAVSPESVPTPFLDKAARRRTFHFAPVENNPRLEKVLALLRRGPATTIKITNCCGTTRASSDISELRANGHKIDCKYIGKTEVGRKVHRYTLT